MTTLETLLLDPDMAGVWNLAPDRSAITFKIRNMWGLLRVKGRYTEFSGDGQLTGNGAVYGRLDIRAASLRTGIGRRDQHLCSADFFDVENHPKMRFVSTKIVGDISDDFKVVGDLTIRGTTREITLDVSLTGRGNDPWGNERMGFEAKGKVNRLDFGLHYNPALETGGFVVGDEVKISIDVELIKQKPEAA